MCVAGLRPVRTPRLHAARCPPRSPSLSHLPHRTHWRGESYSSLSPWRRPDPLGRLQAKNFRLRNRTWRTCRRAPSHSDSRQLTRTRSGPYYGQPSDAGFQPRQTLWPLYAAGAALRPLALRAFRISPFRLGAPCSWEAGFSSESAIVRPAAHGRLCRLQVVQRLGPALPLKRDAESSLQHTCSIRQNFMGYGL